MRRRGFSLPELMVSVGIIAVLGAMAITSVLGARSTANEASIIAVMRAFIANQNEFYVSDLDADGVADYATSLSELFDADQIDSHVASGSKSGYTFTISAPNPRSDWFAVAHPDSRGRTGFRSFYVDSKGWIRYGFDVSVGPDSQPLQ